MRRFRLPLFVVACLLVGLIALLATLQYRWLGQISDAERDRMRTTLRNGATEFAQDFDRELTRAYLLFQLEPGDEDDLAVRFAARYDQWQATARFPRLLKDFYLFGHDSGGRPRLQRFNPSRRQLEAAAWPDSMANWRERLLEHEIAAGDSPAKTVFIARMSRPIWTEASAIVAPMPLPLRWIPEVRLHAGDGDAPGPLFSYAILTLDLDYVRTELLPSLAARHFGHGAGPLEFNVAVVRAATDGGVLYTSDPSFAPSPASSSDASADLFQVRAQDFSSVAAEVRRFTAFAAAGSRVAAPRGERRRVELVRPSDGVRFRESKPLSIVVQGAVAPPGAPRTLATETRLPAGDAPAWKLVLQHPSGSLDAAVASVRRRNLIVSSSVLGVLGASMGLLVLSTRRAQRLARQQMEFVAAVSHELRTPLAVIRSAADNLAEGVVHDEEQVRKYGELMRSEGRRLTGMVEQILELAGIQSGQRGFELRAVSIGPVLEDVIASAAALIESAGVRIEMDIPPGVPPVLGDEAALRRVFQNLLVNAIKYGASGGWVGVSASAHASEVCVTVSDRGMGIPADEQARVFEPFYRAAAAVAAQIHGAGLGLSLVQRTVEAHGGRVSVKSAPGEGSAFTVQLPAAGSAALDRTQAASGADHQQAPSDTGLAGAPRY